MSKQTDFAREFLAWKESLKFQDDSPEAFEEMLRLQQVDRRVQYLLGDGGVTSWQETVEILNGDFDADANEWHDSLGTIDIGAYVVTEDEIEEVPLD